MSIQSNLPINTNPTCGGPSTVTAEELAAQLAQNATDSAVTPANVQDALDAFNVASAALGEAIQAESNQAISAALHQAAQALSGVNLPELPSGPSGMLPPLPEVGSHKPFFDGANPDAALTGAGAAVQKLSEGLAEQEARSALGGEGTAVGADAMSAMNAAAAGLSAGTEPGPAMSSAAATGGPKVFVPELPGFPTPDFGIDLLSGKTGGVFFEDILAAFMFKVMEESQGEVNQMMDAYNAQVKDAETKGAAGGAGAQGGGTGGVGGTGTAGGDAATDATGGAVSGGQSAMDVVADGTESRAQMFEKLKVATQKLSQMQTALSNILNVMHTTAMSTIRNIK